MTKEDAIDVLRHELYSPGPKHNFSLREAMKMAIEALSALPEVQIGSHYEECTKDDIQWEKE